MPTDKRNFVNNHQEHMHNTQSNQETTNSNPELLMKETNINSQQEQLESFSSEIKQYKETIMNTFSQLEQNLSVFNQRLERLENSHVNIESREESLEPEEVKNSQPELRETNYSQNEEETQIINTIEKIDTQMSILHQKFDERISSNLTQETVFNSLYSELEALKQNADFEKIKPLYIDLILLFDRIKNIESSLTQKQTVSISEFSEILNNLGGELLEILERRSIELVQSSSSLFNPREQKAIKTEPTDIENENNQISQIIRKGFRYQDKILRAEEVIVKKYQQ